MSTNPTKPATDGSFHTVTVQKQSARARPATDAAFSDLVASQTNYAFGNTVKDLGVNHLAVTGTIAGTRLFGDGQSVIGRV